MSIQPEVIWADGAGDAPCTHDSIKYWKAPEFLSWLYNESPVKDTTIANSRWGSPAVGDYSTGGDRYVRTWFADKAYLKISSFKGSFSLTTF